MGYEVDFLAVGEGERSGDAIALRFGNLAGPRNQQQVWVIDGGTKESGKELVNHIKTYYRTDRVDVVVSTHPDSDHASGLSVVLEEMKVGVLLMHQPWNHAENIRQLFEDERVTPSGIEERVWRALQDVRELEKIANMKGIKIIEPFSNNGYCALSQTAKLHVLSPSIQFYRQQLANFRCMPEAVQKDMMAPLMEAILGKVKEAARALETWFEETLTDPDPDATSAENNSSVVLLFELDGSKLLFTADAGVPALTEAASRAEKLGIDLRTVSFIQVPHHGSKRNVGPTILNQIVGPIKTPESYDKTAFVSASKDGQPKHPAKKVVNAFMRRGANVFATQGKGLWYYSNDAPKRYGWSAATPLQFYDVVDE
uniref:Metallo-beta-lactamase family protein n=2 Tax=Candidatus Bipolaricaulota TaxID=67810 RepID=H5SMH4_9BACT|nr:metallo-beta-lactamase family protein [uncultured Acetothermia bacterium]BAL58876.1 metallo-beta-lactamase family protein [Candidatus Acetothermum autotrophicum]